MSRVLSCAAYWACLCLLAAPARADGPWMCLAARGGRVPGPCQVPEPGKFLPGAGAGQPALGANFGLVLPGASGWQYICDDSYAAAPVDRLWRAPAGDLLAGSAQGLLRSDDGCAWLPVEGDVAGQVVDDLVVESRPAGWVWALATVPGTVYMSTDGGRRFVMRGQVAGTLPGGRMRGAPSDSTRLYVTAGLAGMPPALWVSRDYGRLWNPETPAVTLPGPLSVLAVAPDDPETVYFKVTEPEGDELWKSGDGGKTLARLLKLADFELLAGLAFGPAGPSGQTEAALYVAGRAPIVVDGVPPGRLYVSRDGGGTWQAPIPSPPGGPSYRCLEFSRGKLFACAAGEVAGDSFMLGVSEDEGRSWAPVVRLADVHGPRECVRDRCLRTELWLCETYGQCAAKDGGADVAGDAGVDGAVDGGADGPSGPSGPPGPSGGDCGCDVGAAPRSRPLAGVLVMVLLMGLGLVMKRRNKSGA